MKTSVLVDSNILLDILQADPASGWSRRALVREGAGSSLLVNPIVWAEISARFADERQMLGALAGLGLEQVPLPFEAAFLAGKAHHAYRRAGGTRERTFPDFLIGAHALVGDHRLLTRDASRYRTCFPAVELVAPDTHP